MQNRADAELLARYEKNSSFDELVARHQAEGLTGDAVYNAIIKSSTRSRPEVNKALKIDPENPPPLPPVWPSNPIWGQPTLLPYPPPRPPPPSFGDDGF